MGDDVLATQGARASATMIFTMLNRINSVPARKASKLQWNIHEHKFVNNVVMKNCVKHGFKRYFRGN